MSLDKYADLIISYINKQEHEILDEFQRLPNAISIGRGKFRSVYVPGTRKDRVLLVAHVDTVPDDSPFIKVVREGDRLISGCRHLARGKKSRRLKWFGLPFGADDRAGVAMLSLFKDSGHSFLLTNGEEIGGCSSYYIATRDYNTLAELQRHQFAIQFDRRGRANMVFYHVGTDEFKEYCCQNTGYMVEEGSFTDIANICRRICGVNISIGYFGEHTPQETLMLDWWYETYDIVNKWISQEGLPRFIR